MKNKKKGFFIVMMILHGIVTYSQSFGGVWSFSYRPDSLYSVFSLSLSKNPKKPNQYIGEYVYSYMYGRRIETGSVKMISQKGNTANINLLNTGDYEKVPITYTIKLLSDTFLYFCCPQPEEAGIPFNMNMKRVKKE